MGFVCSDKVLTKYNVLFSPPSFGVISPTGISIRFNNNYIYVARIAKVMQKQISCISCFVILPEIIFQKSFKCVAQVSICSIYNSFCNVEIISSNVTSMSRVDLIPIKNDRNVNSPSPSTWNIL